jgi:hypothetical protein
MLSQAGLAVGTRGRLHQLHGAVALAGTIQAGISAAVGASRALRDGYLLAGQVGSGLAAVLAFLPERGSK